MYTIMYGIMVMVFFWTTCKLHKTLNEYGNHTVSCVLKYFGLRITEPSLYVFVRRRCRNVKYFEVLHLDPVTFFWSCYAIMYT